MSAFSISPWFPCFMGCLMMGGSIFASTQQHQPSHIKQAMALPELITGKEDLILTADNGVEFYPQDNMCIAKGAACVKKGHLTIYGDRIYAYLSGKKEKKTLKAFRAQGNIRVIHPSGIVKGDVLTYRAWDKMLIMQGKKIVLSTDKGTLIAHKVLSYCHKTGKAKAEGGACFFQKTLQVKADRLEALFLPVLSGKMGKRLVAEYKNKEKNGKSVLGLDKKISHKMLLEWIQANGHVSIKEEGVLATSNDAFYNAPKQCLILKNKVILLQGKNRVSAGKIFFNMKTKTIHALSSGLDQVQCSIWPHSLHRDSCKKVKKNLQR